MLTIKFRIRHIEQGDVYYHDITIKQHPAMIIECKPNRKVNSKGGVSVNGSTSTSSNYGGVHGLTGQNTNPNMYVIKTSVLPADSEYILGDPRALDVNNLSNNSWNEAKGIENLSGSNRELQNYYPTLTTDAAIIMISSPKSFAESSIALTFSAPPSPISDAIILMPFTSVALSRSEAD